jgi:hypothetical protein
VPLGQILSRKKQGANRVIYEKEENFIYIPVLESLKQMLSNERISSMVMKKPKCCNHGVFYDIQDGKVYEDDEYFKQHENSMKMHCRWFFIMMNLKCVIQLATMQVLVYFKSTIYR